MASISAYYVKEKKNVINMLCVYCCLVINDFDVLYSSSGERRDLYGVKLGEMRFWCLNGKWE